MNSKENIHLALNDKISVLQVIGNLIRNPLLFANKDYQLHIEDFPERFHKIVFGAINHLALQGMSLISPLDIDQYLIKYDVQYKIFSDNSGLMYVQKCLEIAEPKKFDYYYNVLKKYSLLNHLNSLGFDVTTLIDPTLTDPNIIAQMQSKFDHMSIEDIINIYEGKLIEIKQVFDYNTDIIKCHAGAGLMELKNSLKAIPDMGLPLVSPKCTTIFRGQRLKTFYMESSYTGGGKTRRALGEAAHLAIPQFYDTNTQQWVNTNLQENVLFISIELDPEELQTPLIAYVSGVPESHILDGKYLPDEEDRVDKAIHYIEESNLKLVQISNFNIDDIENIIKQHKQQYNTRYVFYDYLATSIKIMAEAASKTRMGGLREDQILLMMATRLKELSTRLNIHIRASSQLNREWLNAKIVDQSLLRGSQAMADKLDAGIILLPPRDDDEGVIQTYLRKGFNITPNLVLHIYKARKGKLNHIRLYIHFDYATCRSEDCFVANSNGEIIDVADTNVEVILESTELPLIENTGFEF